MMVLKPLMSEQTSEFYEFGLFRVKSDERVLLRGQDLVSLTPKAFDILLTLLENDGRIVPKDDLMKKVWPNTFVEEGNLTQNVSLLRKALGESANGPQFIETVPRRGYRFVAPVNKTNGEQRRAPNETRNRRHCPAPLPDQFTTIPERRKSKAEDSELAFTVGSCASRDCAGIAYLSSRNKAGAAPTAIQSIAVLPFVDDSPGEDAAFLDDEIAESLVNSLTKLPKLRVVPRSVMVSYKGRNIDPRQVGKELNVRAVVTGRVRRHGDTISIQADLIDLDSVSQIWGQHYDRRLSDILLVQEEISRDIFENLRLKLNVEEQKQLEAYRLYLKGRNAWNKRTPEGLQQGIDFFSKRSIPIRTTPRLMRAWLTATTCRSSTA